MSVAASKMTSQPSLRAAHDTPSARTSRPSASVLFTSTVLPECMKSTSSGLTAFGPIAFSARQSSKDTLCLQPLIASARNAPSVAAAPTHVALHARHEATDLEVEPTGVVGDALAHERNVLGAARGASGVYVAIKEPRFLERTTTHAVNPAEPVIKELVAGDLT